MAEIKFTTGDATQPQGDGPKLIVHCCNNLGKWGAGFVVALSKRWSAPERMYGMTSRYKLGDSMIVKAEDGIWVANIIGQDGIGLGKDGLPPIRYEALRKGFLRAAGWCIAQNQPLIGAHMPRIGSGLAGGDWALVERLIETTFIKKGVDVTVYDLPGGQFFDSRTDER